AMVAEQLRGLLPPGHLGVGVLKSIVTRVRPLVEYALPLRQGIPRAVDVDIDLGDLRLTGTVPEIHGNTLVRVSYSSLGAKHRIAGWIDALALAAGAPDENWTVHTIGRHRSSGKFSLVKPLPAPDAARWLRDLVEVYRQGLCEPLPLPLKTSLVWAEEHSHVLRGREADPDQVAAGEWVTPRFNDSGFPKEDSDAWHVRSFGLHAGLDALTTPVRPEDTAHPGVSAEVPPLPHRLGHYSWRVWGPLLTGDRELVRGI